MDDEANRKLVHEPAVDNSAAPQGVLAAVVASAKAGKRSAQRRLLAKFMPGIRSAAAFAGRDKEGRSREAEIDDLVMIGQAALFEALRSFDSDKGAFASYGMQRVRWRMADEVKKHANRWREVSETDALEEQGRSSANDGAGDETPLITIGRPAKQNGGLFHAAALPEYNADDLDKLAAQAGLDATDTEILQRRVFGDDTQEEVARALGMSRQRVSQRQARSEKALRGGDVIRRRRKKVA